MLLVGWQEGHPACKNLQWWGTGMVICLERDADLHISQPMPLPLTVSCSFVVPAHLGSSGQRAVKRVCVCVCFNGNYARQMLWTIRNGDSQYRCMITPKA